MAYTKPLVYGSILPRGGGTVAGRVLMTVSLRTVDDWYIENVCEGRWAAWRFLPHICFSHATLQMAGTAAIWGS
jgi:hypothetical protein